MRPYLMIKRSQLASFESNDAVHHSAAAIILRNRHVGQPDSWKMTPNKPQFPPFCSASLFYWLGAECLMRRRFGVRFFMQGQSHLHKPLEPPEKQRAVDYPFRRPSKTRWKDIRRQHPHFGFFFSSFSCFVSFVSSTSHVQAASMISSQCAG